MSGADSWSSDTGIEPAENVFHARASPEISACEGPRDVIYREFAITGNPRAEAPQT